MARSHSHRRVQKRQKHGRGPTRLGMAGGVCGVVCVTAVAGLVVVVRSHSDQAGPTPHAMAARKNAVLNSPGGRGPISNVRNPAQLKTGAEFAVSTPEGFSYSLAAVEAGMSEVPLASTRTAPPYGSTLGYIDYVIRNTSTGPALLDFPADLFVRRSQVPPAGQSRCMTQPGAPADMCMLPAHADVVNTLGFPPPRSKDGDQYIPTGATYLVRVATDSPVLASATGHDFALYVWNPRFAPDRRALQIPLP